MTDDLERRAIIAAHDAGCSDRCDITVMPSLNKREQAIVALWRAEVERLRTATGMADELGARVTDERNEAQAAIERVRAITYASDDGSEYEHTHPDGGEPECPACWAEGIRAALDRTEATDA